MLGLNHPKHTWKLVIVIKLSIEIEKEDMICELCTRTTLDIAVHFILTRPLLYSSRDSMMEEIVNVLNVQNYVNLTTMDENKIVNTILRSKHHIVIQVEE